MTGDKMGEIVRGQDVTVQVFDGDGAIVATLNPTSFSVNVDSDEERQTRLGEREEMPRQVLHGFSGSASFEEEGPILDDLIDTQQARFLAADKTFVVEILATTYYPETGTERTYLYPNAVFKISKNVSDKSSPTERTLDWTSSMRKLI